MIYDLMLRIIDRGVFAPEEILEKLDIYLLFNRISQPEYEFLANRAASPAEE